MKSGQIERISAALSYIERHLDGKLDLDTVAGAVCCSKYHLHRMFTGTAGITPHDYIRRRQLTEAAKLLVSSGRPIAEIALTAGYESQQAFTSVFKSMYKRTPLELRRSGTFYPLQLELVLHPAPSGPDAAADQISRAGPEDIPGWMELARLAVDGLPCWECTSHLVQVERHIRRGQALIMRDGPVIIGAAAFSRRTGHIDFLAVHPQYRRRGVAEAFLALMTRGLSPDRTISITTFRAGDRADTGQRATYERLGFVGAELLTEFGYPTQRLILPPRQGGSRHAQ